MNANHLEGLDQIKKFVAGTESVAFTPQDRQEAYAWLTQMLVKLDYFRLGKRDKGVAQGYLRKVTGYSRQPLTRLIKQYKTDRKIGANRKPRHVFPHRYQQNDILLLAKTDACHQTLSGGATKKLFERAYTLYGDLNYERLSQISIAHIYNLRRSSTDQNQRRHFTKTQKSKVEIGCRRRPMPNGEPGYLRVDTVHQGDQNKEKGVYHINTVDEVTQFEIVCSVEHISERYLIPILRDILDAFPFKIRGFHTDNGSEYVNKVVAQLLNKLLIEFTKSRPRRSNDNGLVESKNGSIVRKYFGYSFISKYWAKEMNLFSQRYLNPYLNFHRPSYFATIKINSRGKEKKTYPYKNIMTPYEKLKSLPNACAFLKEGITFADLDKKVKEKTDLESAQQMQTALKELFQKIFSPKHSPQSAPHLEPFIANP
ncbi:MAG: transposase family protein [Proteobacteria bacterium]|nr:transposase family protein [Pseudomonadota bacterium]